VSEAFTATLHAAQDSTFLGPALLAAALAFGALFYVPRFSLYLLGGLLFGFVAAPAAVIGSTLGAVAAFLLARHTLRDAFLRRIEHRPAWRAVLAAINREGWRLVVLVRFASPLPGGGINYVCGLTSIGLWPYTAATCLGLVPPILTFVAIGALGRLALEDVSAPWQQRATITGGAIVLALVVLLVLRRMRKNAAALSADERPATSAVMPRESGASSLP
jgi:uncharacterized membrane protein YdjX (TVP38/TMEM64 family)